MEKAPQVVGLGMATLDVLLRLEDMPTWDRGTRLSDFRFDGGGPVGTAIVAAAKLGALAGFIGTAGDDAAAELKLRSFVSAGVDLSRIVRREAPEDQIVIVYVHEGSGERVFSGMSRPTNTRLLPEDLDRAYITSADYLHLDGWHAEAALQAAKWMQEAGKTVVMDGSKTTGFSIHALAKGTTSKTVVHVYSLVSIHAPHRVRLYYTNNFTYSHSVSIHALARRATWLGVSSDIFSLVSIHAPRRERPKQV